MKTDIPEVQTGFSPREGHPQVTEYAGIQSVHWLTRQFGDKWSLPVLCRLSGGPMRFSQLRHGLEPISQRMLTRTLKKLERIGVVSRDSTDGFPLHVTYSLTERGTALLDPLWRLHNWMQTHGSLAALDE